MFYFRRVLFAYTDDTQAISNPVFDRSITDDDSTEDEVINMQYIPYSLKFSR